MKEELLKFHYFGSSFTKDELSAIKLNDLKPFTFCPGHLFFYSALNEKLIPIKRAGEILEPGFFEKYKKVSSENLYIYHFIDQDKVQHYKNLWSEFKNAKFEKDKILSVKKITDLLKQDYVESHTETSILNYIAATFDSFNKLNPQFWLEYQERDFVFFQRSLINATFSMSFAVINGFYEYEFLRDLFVVIAHLDYSMVTEGISYNLVLACEAERQQSGNGVKKLKELNSPLSEIQKFIQHPKDSYNLAKKISKNLHYPEVIEYIKFHHEKNDGSGFPLSIGYGAIASWESLLQLGDNLFEFKEIIFSRKDGAKFLLNRFKDLRGNLNLTSLPIHHHLKKCEVVFFNLTEVDKEVG